LEIGSKFPCLVFLLANFTDNPKLGTKVKTEVQIGGELGLTLWIFPLYFQLPYLLEETCFSKQDLLWWEVLARLYWDLLKGNSQPITISKK
jgi:hypothetical protein